MDDRPDPTALRVGMLSDRGERANNEDACGHVVANGLLCCAVADGAGGHQAGEVAARLAVRTTLQGFQADPGCDAPRVAALIDAAQQAVLAAQKRDPARAQMRSTLVVLVCDPRSGQACWGHAGDSRLYLLRQQAIVARTRDHSLVQSLIEAGMAGADAPWQHPQRNVLLSALGSDEDFMRTVSDVTPLLPGDALLLCSDGLWGSLPDGRIEQSPTLAGDPNQWLRELQAAMRPRDGSAQDNYSAIAVFHDGDPDRTMLL